MDGSARTSEHNPPIEEAMIALIMFVYQGGGEVEFDEPKNEHEASKNPDWLEA